MYWQSNRMWKHAQHKFTNGKVVAEFFWPHVEDAGRHVFAMEQQLEQITGAQHISAEDIGCRVSVMERRLGKMAGGKQTCKEGHLGISGMAPFGEMNPNEFITAIDNVHRLHTGNTK